LVFTCASSAAAVAASFGAQLRERGFDRRLFSVNGRIGALSQRAFRARNR
jgi:hypothetical protein